MLGMDILEDVSTTHKFGFNVNSWMGSDVTRKSEIYAFCQVFVDKFVDFSYRKIHEPLMSVLSNFNKSVLEEETKSSRSKVVSSDKDMKLIINELMGLANVFNEIPGRIYKHACLLTKEN